MTDLKLFIQPDLLQRIGARRLGILLRPFAPELQAINFPMPPPDEPGQNDYFHTLAAAIARTDAVPDSVLKVLLTLETAASPRNNLTLEAAIKRRLPNVSLPPDFVLDRALEVWIVAPEELARFAPAQPKPTEIKTQNSKIENPSPAGPPIHQSINPLIQSSPAAPDAPDAPHAPDDFARLARLSPAEYDRARRAEAKRLGLRLRTLDDAVEEARGLLDDAEANNICLPQPEPWPEPITDAPGLFDQVHDRALLYLYLPPGGPVILTLWPGHAHAINAFTHTPRLNLTSAQPGCGKSTVLDFLAPLCPRVLHTNNLKPAVLYRAMHRGQLTVFLDEVDVYLQLYPELRGLLNASNKPTSCVHRCEGNVVRVFKIFAPTALAGIGQLTPTLHHRSIVLTLEEAPGGVLKARFDPRHIETEIALGRQIARWARDNFAALAACDPVMPPKVHNRLADNWRPLFAIAQTIGGHWPHRILDAFNHLNSPPSIIPSFHHSNPTNPSIHQSINPLLADLRLIFTQSGADRLFSCTLVDSLCALPNRPWSAVTRDNGSPKPISEAWLSRQLRPFGVRSRTLRINGVKAKGYELADFVEAFAKHLNANGPKSQ
ncbi:MAG TPA: DUF3631 domain-containing protein [Candidatus Binatia bacterium]|jgi:hypothetical protein|nr:DUF3631 domain-containing protein [Candidatus Binatia bacterium]